jgi:hypothetical protein
VQALVAVRHACAPAATLRVALQDEHESLRVISDHVRAQAAVCRSTLLPCGNNTSQW